MSVSVRGMIEGWRIEGNRCMYVCDTVCETQVFRLLCSMIESRKEKNECDRKKL